ncbi:MAG: hypothetical protein K6E76_04220 [Patescibacteria group bacterium]|nr:hypothetical protein [Patescibacteria group bacterium]
MDQILGSLLSSSEIQNSLKEKLGKTALTESEIQILYLQYLVENPSEKLTFHPTSTDLFDKYG